MQEARDTVISKTCRASVYHQGAGMGEEMVKRIKPKESCRVQVISLTVWEGVGRREQEGGNAADLPQGLLAEGRATHRP